MDETQIAELLVEYLPESAEGWLGLLLLACALVSIAVPAPSGDSHPAWKVCWRIICVAGLGAGKIRTAGKLGTIAGILRKKP